MHVTALAQSGNLALATNIAIALCAIATARADVLSYAGWYCDLDSSKDIQAKLELSDDKITVRTEDDAFSVDVPYDSISQVTHHKNSRANLTGLAASGAAISPAGAAWFLLKKPQLHWLVIDHGFGAVQNQTVLRLRKNEYQEVIASLERKIKQPVVPRPGNSKPADPTDGSKDVDVVIPLAMEEVVPAVRTAMASVACKVEKETASEVKCRRARGNSELTGVGGETVIATIASTASGTRMRLITKKSAVRNRNWSAPIYLKLSELLVTEAPWHSNRVPSSRPPVAENPGG